MNKPFLNKQKEDKGINVKIAKIVCVILLLIALLIYATIGNLDILGFFKSESLDIVVFNEIGTGINYELSANPSFYTYSGANGYFYATKDGVKFYLENGEQKISEMYNMTSPLFVGEGDVVAVAEQRGNMLYVYNQNGELYQKQLPNPISSFSINEKGQACVIMHNESEYEFSVFSAKGDLIKSGTLPDENIFPVVSDISNDGRILAILFYDIRGVSIRSPIKFYYLNKSEAMDYTDSIFGENDESDGQAIHLIRFMNNNRLLTVSNEEISCIDAESSCAKIWKMELNNKIDAVCFNGTNTFAVALGEGLLNKPSEPEGLVKIYAIDMSEMGTYQFNGRVLSLTPGPTAVIAGNERDFTAISNKGEILWEYKALQDIKRIFFINGTNHVLMASENSASIYKAEKKSVPINSEDTADSMIGNE